MALDAKTRAHLDAVKYFRDEGAPSRDTGQLVSFRDTADRNEMGRKWGLDVPDWETRKRNIELFKRSNDFKIRSPYRQRLF